MILISLHFNISVKILNICIFQIYCMNSYSDRAVDQMSDIVSDIKQVEDICLFLGGSLSEVTQ